MAFESSITIAIAIVLCLRTDAARLASGRRRFRQQRLAQAVDLTRQYPLHVAAGDTIRAAWIAGGNIATALLGIRVELLDRRSVLNQRRHSSLAWSAVKLSSSRTSAGARRESTPIKMI